MDATALKEKGNAFYKKGQVLEAIEAYLEAAALSPENALPQSNLSAAYYETGQYEKCVAAASAALKLLGDERTPLREKLRSRLCLAYLHLQQSEMAAKVAKAVDKQAAEYGNLIKCTEQTNSIYRAFRSTVELRRDILKELSSYKPALQAVPEYYIFGHDNAQSLFDADLDANTPRDKEVSLLFAGIGDARNLYATLVMITESELKAPSKRTFQITVNDIKPHVIARNLVIWLLLDELTKNEDSSLEITNAVFFIFCTAIMPAGAYGWLQSTISKAIMALETGTGMPSWVKVPSSDHPLVLQVLESWKNKAPQLYSNSFFVTETLRAMRSEPFSMDGCGVPEECRGEVDCYWRTLALRPPRALMHKEELELERLFRVFDTKKSPSAASRVRTYIEANWKPNVTMFDVEWEKVGEHFRDNRPDVWRFPDQLFLASRLPRPKHANGIFDYVRHFFGFTLSALKNLEGRLEVRTSVGDITQVLESFRYDPAESIELVGDEQGEDLSPRKFDRIHLSNIPDYVGCNLFSFLYAVPLLKHHEASFVTSTCLRNTPAWKSIDSFNNESIMINDSERLFKLLQVTYAGNLEDPGKLCLYPWPLGDYLKWSSPTHGPHSFNMLLPRAAFCNWLYGLFFKLALPVMRHHNYKAFGISMMVYSPCNLVVFFRLLMHLRSIGYPSHWLSTVLGSILADNVSTSARPPATCPLDIQEVNYHKPPKRITTSPYVAEMSTLTTLFLRLLPFAVYGSGVDIPSPQSIRECTVQFQKVDVLTESNRPDFVLVFTKLPLMQDAATRGKLKKPQYMRDLLQDDSLLDQHKHSIVMVSTWKWDPVVEQAVFWMREDVVNSMLDSAGQWICEINRTDNWLSASYSYKPTMNRTTLKVGRRWVDRPAVDDFQNLPVRTLHRES